MPSILTWLVDASTGDLMPERKQDRSALYYRRRLERDHPAIFAELEAGRIGSVSQAAAKAGLIRLPSRLDALKRHWKKATPAQQAEFIRWVKAARSLPSSRMPPPTSPEPVVDTDGRLLSTAAARIKNVMRSRGIKLGVMMKEMGFNPLNASIGSALAGYRLHNPHLIHALERWVESNKSHWETPLPAHSARARR